MIFMKMFEIFLFAEHILQSTMHNGFPVVVSLESQYLVGFVIRRDLSIAISKSYNYKKNPEFSNYVKTLNIHIMSVSLLLSCIFVF